jgi:hypothetical protein
MKNIKEVILDNEKIYLTKDMFGHRVVNPIKNSDGSLNWKNLILGNRKVIIFTIIWLLIMGFIFYGVNEMTSSCKDMAKNPCNYFKIDCSTVRSNYNFTLKGGDKNES